MKHYHKLVRDKIPEIIERVMDEHTVKYNYTLEDVLAADKGSRSAAAEIKF